MKHKLILSSLLLLALAPTALASNTWYVDGVNGSDSNNCKTRLHACKTIGHAISLASSGDMVFVAAATYAEILKINFSLKVIGSGASTTIIDGGGVHVVIFITNTNAHVTLSGFTIRNGKSPSGAGILNGGTLTVNDSFIIGNTADGVHGGGIDNGGPLLTINNSIISGNSVNGDGVQGGGIYNYSGSTLTINNSTITRNTARGFRRPGVGGGIYNGGRLTVNRSTLSGNQSAFGGGIGNDSGGTAKINDSTLSGNYAVRGSGIDNSGTATIDNSTLNGNFLAYGIGNFGTLTISNSTISSNHGGIDIFSGAATLQNSIVANNVGAGNCSGTLMSEGYNLSSDNTCDFDNSGDLNNTDPLLGALQNNGGPTQTQALLSGSPAIDAGNPGGCTDGNGHLLKTDQRGKPRPDHEDTGGCDMGAFERQKD